MKSKRDIIFYTGVNSPKVKMAIGTNETFAVCGNALDYIFIFIINQNNKLEWTLYKKKMNIEQKLHVWILMKI